MSSASERILPEVANGYEASVSDDLDQGDRESRRSTIRPPPAQHTLPLVTAPRSRSPAAYHRPQTPPNILSPERPQMYSPDSQTLRADRIIGASLPTPPMPSNSPQALRFNEDAYQAPTQYHGRSGSEAALDRERSIQGSEVQTEINERSLRYQDRMRQDRERVRKDTQQRREGGLRRAKAQHEPSNPERRAQESWTVVPSGLPTSSYRRDRPTTPQDPPRPSGSGSPRFQPSSGYPLNIPQHPRAPPPAPPGPSGESRSHSKRQHGKPVPPGWSIAYRGPQTQKPEKPLKSPPTPPWHKVVAKSMNDLRGSYKAHSQIPTSLQPGKARPTPPQLPAVPTISRPSTSDSAHSVNGITPSNSSSGTLISPSHNESSSYQELGLPKSYEGSRGGPHSPVIAYHPLRPANPSAYSAGTSIGTSYLGLTSPGQEPYPRPRSALGSDPTTSPYNTPRQLQSPRTSEFPQEVTVHPALQSHSPHVRSAGLSASSSGTIYDEMSPGTYGPRPSHAGHPRSDSLSGSDYSVSAANSLPSQVPRSPLTARSLVPELNPDRSVVEPAPPVKRTLSSLPLMEVEDDGESTVRRDDVAHYISLLEQETSGTMMPQKPTTPTPPRLPTPTMSEASSSVGTGTTLNNFIPCNDDDSEGDEEDFWVKKPKKPAQTAETSQAPWQQGTLQARPVSNSRPILPPISTDSSPVSRPAALPSSYSSNRTPSNHPSPPNYVPAPPPRQRRPTAPPPTAGNNRLQDQRTSRFDNNFDYTWAPRPPPEEVFERLQEYFPEHDVDKPVIEAQSGGTSPTSAEQPTLPAQAQAERKFRHKKSIRVVAAEGKRRGDRVSRVEQMAAPGPGLRKRNTKLWGSRLQEVTSASEAASDQTLVGEASPGGGAKRMSLSHIVASRFSLGFWFRSYLQVGSW